MKNKSIVFGIILLFLLSNSTAFVSSSYHSINKTIYVDDDGGADYSKIQDAIDNASDGDTVFVYIGIYRENIIVHKSIILQGEDRNYTIIDANKTGKTVDVIVNSVEIYDFTLQNSGHKAVDAGVSALTNYSIFSGNILIDNEGSGFYILGDNNTISNNNFFNNSKAITLASSKNNVIKRNIINDNFEGVRFITSNHNQINENIISNNNFGIYLPSWYSIPGSENTSIYRNNITNNEIGITLYKAKNSEIYRNNFYKNTRNVKFWQSHTNKWDGNYWDRPRILPKIIIGKAGNVWFGVPWINIDWHPAKELNILKPVIEVGPYTQNVKDESITIVWETNIPTIDNYVLFYETTDYKYKVYGENNSFHHEITIQPGFSSGYYRVFSDTLQSKDYNFHLSNQCLNTEEFRCILFGDSRGMWDEWGHASLVAIAINNELPDIVIHGGDMVSDGSVNDQWSSWLDLMMPLMQNSTVYGVIGNHERNTSRYYEIFALPNNEMWYNFDYGPCHFIILDNYVAWDENSVQYSWLEADLSMTNQPFIIVCFHEPIYCSGGHSPRIDIRDSWEPLFNHYDVDLVVQSHCHYYQRTIPINDTVYIVSGGAGAPLYSPSDDWFINISKKAYHYCILDVSLDAMEMTCTVKDIDGVIIDEFQI